MAKIENTLPPITTSTGGGTSIHNDLSGLNVGNYIHLTATEKTKFDNLPNSFAPIDAEKNVNTDWNATLGDEQLLNKPSTFPPSIHTHIETDIVDLDKYTQLETDNLLNNKVDKITGKGLSTEDYTTIEKSKLSGIEVGAEVNNISDTNATDLTNGGDTTLHNHDSRYYTETEVDSLIDSKVEDAIVNGVTTKAPSQNAVFDALALKIGQAVATNTSNTSTIVGWSSFTFKIIVEYDFGNGFVFVDYFIQGASNSATTSFTLINNNTAFQRKETTVGVQNNGIVSNTNGLYVINTNSNVVSFFINNTESTFTGSNQKSIRGNFIYYKG